MQIFAVLSDAQTLPGTVISNTAQAGFTANSVVQTELSNPVDIVTRAPRSDATIDLIKVTQGGGTDTAPLGATQCLTGGVLTPLAPAVLLDGTVIDPQVLQDIVTGGLLHASEPLFVRVVDPDQNRDGLVIDPLTVTVSSAASGDSETIVLTETGPNSGVFTGYLPTAPAPATVSDCLLQVLAGGELQVAYQDPADPADRVSRRALVDPVGVVFDSVSGQPVDGAFVTLIDAGTGQPASVLGDDGVSSFPAQVVSGGTVTDTGGTIYQFATGQFRFPLIAPGTYRLQIQPPVGYAGPSSVSVADLQILPGAPFALSPASFANDFVVAPGPVINIDIPVDPSAVDLFLQKTLTASVAAPGDFLHYTLTLANAAGATPASDVTISDVLPVGFRLVGGSVRVNGISSADPEQGATAGNLTFRVAALAPGAQAIISYVVEVTTAARGREAVNIATATAAGGIVSNTARATVRLDDDFFGDSALLIGRVIDGSCDDDVANDRNGVANVRIYLEDGRYALTDEGGRYHFEGVQAGNHVVQLDVDTIPVHMEIVACEHNSRFAGRAYSQFVDLTPASLWRADFYLREIPPPTGAVALTLESRAVDDADLVDYELVLAGDGVPVGKLRAMVMLPEGASLVAGSGRMDGVAIVDPKTADQTLTFVLGDRQGVWSQTLAFRARLSSAAVGEAITKAVAMFDTPTRKRQRTPLADNRLVREPPVSERFERVLSPRFATRKAELGKADRAEIARVIEEFKGAGSIHVRAIGHTDNVPIATHNRAEFADNQVLSMARARAVGRYAATLLNLPPSRISLHGAGANQPLASNDSRQGRARNRRVQLLIWGERSVSAGQLVTLKSSSGIQRAETRGLSVLEQTSGTTTDPVTTQIDWFGDNEWLEDATPEAALVMPARDANPAIRSLRIVARHGPGQEARLLLNGTQVSPLNFDGVTRNSSATVAASRWRGVDIEAGDNTLELIVLDGNGLEVARVSRRVHFSGGPIRAELDQANSSLIADGRTAVVIALRLFDRDGFPARPDSVGVFHVDPPYRSQWEIEAERDNQLIVVGDRDPVYSVGPDGIARIRLEPSSRAGEVLLRLGFENNREQEIRAWLKPATRDWILVGIAEGTVGFNNISNNIQEADDAGIEEDYYSDGRLAFFAKGRVRGEYLLTLAYDTDRDKEEAGERLFGQIDPDRFYTLYGDATDQRFDAASQEKLYVKLERGQFYALFGDYETNLTVTELARYNRSFQGLKSEYSGDRFGLNLFGARTDQAFVKDEIRGDGTSGLYLLSRRPIIVNSEKVAIEVRDRFHSEQILETRTLTRHLDYDIDYLNGSMFFKQPVPSRDQDFNNVFIVADYESRDGDDTETTWGGRASLKLGRRMVLGASVLREGVSGGEGELYGADLKYALGEVTELRAEIASSETRQNGLQNDGDAYLLELRHEGVRMDGKVYAREQESGFGLGQQRGSEAGTRKFGLDGRLRFSRRLTLNAELFEQRNLASDGQRTVAQAELRYQGDRGTLAVGLRRASDKNGTGDKRDSDQAFVNTSVNALDDKLTLRAGSDFSLAGGSDNSDYPARTTVGLDYRANDRFSLFAEHELGAGSDIDTRTTRVGVRTTPWERARINASVNQSMTEYGPRVFANIGLIQGWQLNERWTLDLGLDQSNTILATGATRFDEDVPLASGNADTDFVSVWLGALFRSEFWSATSRFEYRNSDLEDRAGLLFGLYREEKKGLGFTADAQIFDSARRNGADTLDADIRLGWAFRPAESRWVIFDRLDLDYQDIDRLVDRSTTWKLINNFSANYAPSRHSQISLRYGAKYTRTNVGDSAYTGFTDLIGTDWRRDLGERFDVGVHGSVRHSWRADVYDFSVGFEGGVTLMQNMWLSAGYNFLGFEDDDFRASGFHAQGPYLRLRLKADQDTLAFLRRRLPFDSCKRPVARSPDQN